MAESFDYVQTRSDGISIVDDVVRSTLSRIDTPRSLAIWLLYNSGEHGQLVDLKANSCDYISISQFKDDYFATEFLKKYEGLSGFDPLKTAIEKDAQSEQRCLETNLRLSRLFTPDGGSTPLIESILLLSKRKIARVLGGFTWASLESCRWGPGATSSSKGVFTSAYNKFSEQTIDVSSNALPLMRAYIEMSPIWSGQLLGLKPDGPFCLTLNNFNVVDHNRLTFVNKTAKTHRSICVEPHGNTWLQLGIGKFLRHRLLTRALIDLNDQSINQRLAREGSITGLLATIDLSAASDSIAWKLVEYLFPYDWYLLLDRTRVHFTKMPDGTIRKNEKFSSMGNGFTFELESLIFWALASSACEITGSKNDKLSVFGDDIIVPVEAEPALKEALLFCGFKYNDDKSFVEGPFRESCGTDWLNGVNVRPFLIKEVPIRLTQQIELANKIRLYSWGGSYGCDKRFKHAYQTVLKKLPLKVPRVPLHDQAGGLISNQSESRAIHRTERGWQGWHYSRLHFVSARRPIKRWFPAMATALSNGIAETRGFYTLRDCGKYRVNSGYSFEWPELGPWL